MIRGTLNAGPYGKGYPRGKKMAASRPQNGRTGLAKWIVIRGQPGKRLMFHRPSLRVERKALNSRNLKEQGRKKKISNFLKIAIVISVFRVLRFQWKYFKSFRE
jgi:hypothetical protein